MIFMSLCMTACCQTPGYTAARQLPTIKFPAKSLPVSDRYAIPKISSTDCQVIDEIKPPYY